jgi:hypothetical protein
VIDSMRVLEVLGERGYSRHDDITDGEAWFEATFERAAGTVTVRAVLQDDGGSAIDLFSGPGYTHEWRVTFDPGTPGRIILAVLDGAQHEAKGR